MTRCFLWLCTLILHMFFFYVDEIIIIGSIPNKVNEFIKLLHVRFALKDMGILLYFLGIKVFSLPNQHLLFKQFKYSKTILDRTQMSNVKLVITLMMSSLKLRADKGIDFDNLTL